MNLAASWLHQALQVPGLGFGVEGLGMGQVVWAPRTTLLT